METNCSACGIDTDGCDPCDSCFELMKEGVLLVRVHIDEEGVPHRTGQMALIDMDTVVDMIENEEKLDKVLSDRAAYIPEDAWDMLELPVPNLEQLVSAG